MSARCGQCGGTVMPYRRYALFSRSTAICQNCGQRVRLRSSGLVVGSELLVLGVLVVGLVGATGGSVSVLPVRTLTVVAVLAPLVALLVIDYWSWRALPWDPIAPTAGGRGWIKLVLSIIGSCILALVALRSIDMLVAANQMIPAAEAVAANAGWQMDQLDFRSFKVRVGLLGSSSALVTFRLGETEDPKYLEVHLRRPLLSLRWEVRKVELR